MRGWQDFRRFALDFDGRIGDTGFFAALVAALKIKFELLCGEVGENPARSRHCESGFIPYATD